MSGCGNTFSKSYNAMLKRSECPRCNSPATPKTERKSKTSVLSAEEKQINRTKNTLKKSKKIPQEKVSVLAYNGSKEKLTAHCNECGHEWNIRADHLLSRAYCHLCKKENVKQSTSQPFGTIPQPILQHLLQQKC